MEVVELPSLGMFQNRGDVALRDMVNGYSGGVLGVEWMDSNLPLPSSSNERVCGLQGL